MSKRAERVETLGASKRDWSVDPIILAAIGSPVWSLKAGTLAFPEGKRPPLDHEGWLKRVRRPLFRKDFGPPAWAGDGRHVHSQCLMSETAASLRE